MLSVCLLSCVIGPLVAEEEALHYWATAKPVAVSLKELHDSSSHSSGRVNGARLTATAAVEGDKDRAELKLRWTLDYDGPRPPLVILKPAIDRIIIPSTNVVIYAEGTDRNVYRLVFRSRTISVGLEETPKDLFLTVPKEKPASGTMTIRLADVRSMYQQCFPNAFKDQAPDLHVYIEHRSSLRGEEHGLDAWTGVLHSPLRKVVLRDW